MTDDRLIAATALPGLPMTQEHRGPFTMDIHVVPAGNGDWLVENRSARLERDRTDSVWPTKKEAEDRARKYLKQVGGGNLTLYSQDGKPDDPISVKAR